MGNLSIHEIVERYIQLTHEVWKRGEALIRDEIGEVLTNDQHYLLRYIYRQKRCTPTELAAAFSVQKSAITAIINRLVEKNLIKRTQDVDDRRVIYLTLTDQGKILYEKTEAKIFKLVESIITKFDQQEIESFLKMYGKLAEILKEAQ
ncbi:MarR family transcriptional regulator [Caldifermentibacillus hisashii]|uniref:MarR family winged helix-turn-helix transcriptional regulator n=1 Tax=Bacillaceae TaxID=186817 RepID=UPI000D561F15|nr:MULTISPECIES: MarR family transcriptional regulator [Bacillaceae]AWI13528.1 MarR family transcriptional regulator [Caldibacillus thermoamylovorans]MCM3799680.1 MarR family transcriptional regulator [Caldibacillus thermoamylovorans]MDL0420403.1 MarR family transcriptional regulator [Caldibacillus thermoamylovorans]MED3642938.1 MarR family transcriptional regulator [Caldifermentibacillus hisashii]